MRTKCSICNYTLTYFWTDLYGEGCCTICGTPYQILHYDDDGNMISKSPEINVYDEMVQHVRNYWEAKKVSNGLGLFMKNPYQGDLNDFWDFVNEAEDGQ